MTHTSELVVHMKPSGGAALRPPLGRQLREALLALALGLLHWRAFLGPATRVIAGLFAHLSFAPYVVGREPALRRRFARHLAREVHRKFSRGELRTRSLARWVGCLFSQALRARRLRAASAERPLAFAIISPSSACNLRCAHCYVAAEHGPQTPRLSYEQVEAAVAALEEGGTNLILLSGGEPLAWRDHGRDLFSLAREHPDMPFVVFSNGTLIDERVAQTLAEVGNVLPLVSLEGLREANDRVRGQGAYAAVLRAFAHLRQAGVLFGVSITASQPSAPTLLGDTFFRELEAQGASFLWVVEVAALGRAPLAWALDEPVRDALELALEEKRKAGQLIISFLETPRSVTGCFGADRFDGFVYLDFEGSLRRCVYQPDVRLNGVTRGAKDVQALLGRAGELPPCPLAARATRGSTQTGSPTAQGRSSDMASAISRLEGVEKKGIQP